jgi:oxygen-independent coproporphyrinogen-3 oxidase
VTRPEASGSPAGTSSAAGAPSPGPATSGAESSGPSAFGARSVGARSVGPGSFGAYVHVPFCAKRCDYCAFATWTDRGHLIDRYLAALRIEIRRAVEAGMAAVTSVFFGGGTPSLVPGRELMRVLAELPLAAGAEVTVECNPDTITSELLATYLAGGVSRLSLGVQSMVPQVLALLGRTHEPENVRRSVDLARSAGFETFNVDIIYGAVGESPADWEQTVREVLALDPPHVSAYALTVEAGTALALDRARYPDDDDQASKYELADDLLTAAGLANYEISNWAQPGHECRHNLLYWSQGDYLGFGCSAHSHRDGRRWWNIRTPERYLALVEAGQSTEAAGEELEPDVRRLEGLQLALRTRAGVPAGALDPAELPGLVEEQRDRVVLTRAGRLVANEIALRLRA